MGFWRWLTQPPKKSRRTARKKTLDPQVQQAFGRVKRDLKSLKANLKVVQTQLSKNQLQLTEHSQHLQQQDTRWQTLEEKVAGFSKPIPAPTPPISALPTTSTSVVPVIGENATQRDTVTLQNLSAQEKRILGVFLAHRDMALSYQDIAKTLQKSPHTIKNQLRQLNMKASLFRKSVDTRHQNRFKLHPHLKLETQLTDD